MKKIYYILIVLIIVSVGAYSFYNYLNRPVASIAGKKADLSITPQKLLSDFTADEQAANISYLDKVIVLDGTVSSIKIDEKDNVNIMLNTGDPLSGISCTLDKSETVAGAQLKEGDIVKIKGICTGILMDVIMVNCVIEG